MHRFFGKLKEPHANVRMSRMRLASCSLASRGLWFYACFSLWSNRWRQIIDHDTWFIAIFVQFKKPKGFQIF